MKELIKALQKAHAGEMAAYYAYEGHWKASKNEQERMEILNIQLEEASHILTIRKFLKSLGADSSIWRDFIFIYIGKLAGALCFVSGWRNAMFGARFMETLGTQGYRELALMAAENDRVLMAVKFQSMAKQEEAHERYFKEKLNGNRRAS
jgi:rubrerythrin